MLPVHPEARKRAPPVGKPTRLHTGVSKEETHPYTGVFSTVALPKELQALVRNLNKYSGKKELHFLIQKLCAWQPLTAQQLAEILKRKDKKHFVRSHLTPMVKEGTLKYLFPEDEDSRNQAYTL